MNHLRSPSSRRAAASLTVVVFALVVLAAGIGWGVWKWLPGRSSTPIDVITHMVERGDFSYDVLEQGEIESSSNVEIRCEVKARGTGQMTILEVVEEGTLVEKGDLLVQLDSAALEQDLVEQQIQCNTKEAQMITSRNSYESALISKREYVEGTFYQEEQTLQGEVFLAEENLRRAQEYLAYSERLAARGYVTPQELEGDRFDVAKYRTALDAAKTRLRVLQEYTKPKTLKQLDSDIASAEAAWKSDESSYQLELSNLKLIEEQIEKCVLRAPQAGQVIHANQQSSRSSSEFIVEPGATVREGQAIIRLPDATKMQVKAKVNESRIIDLQAGMAATVRVDAFGDRTFRGEVTRVNEYPEPTSWYSSQVKEYATIIQILDSIKDLRPGLTAEVTVHVLRVSDAIQVPIQAVHEHGRRTYCMVRTGTDQWQAQEIQIAASNDKFVMVESGVNEGDVVAMNPRKLLEFVTLPEIESELAFPANPGGNTPLPTTDADGPSHATGTATAPGLPLGGSSPSEGVRRSGGPGAGGPGAGGPGAGGPGGGRRGERRPGGAGPGGAGPGGSNPGGGSPGGGGMGATAIVDRIFSQLDANGDGQLSAEEIPADRADRIQSGDTNGDGVISREEMTSALGSRSGPDGGGP